MKWNTDFYNYKPTILQYIPSNNPLSIVIIFEYFVNITLPDGNSLWNMIQLYEYLLHQNIEIDINNDNIHLLQFSFSITSNFINNWNNMIKAFELLIINQSIWSQNQLKQSLITESNSVVSIS